MIFPSSSLNEWLKKYPELDYFISDTQKRKAKCSNCQKISLPKKPFMSKDYIGLLSEECEHCGKPHFVSVSSPRSVEEEQRWQC